MNNEQDEIKSSDVFQIFYVEQVKNDWIFLIQKMKKRIVRIQII